MRDMQRTMGLIIALAVFFAFVVLAVQFNRLKLPLLILLTLPACLAGMVGALYITGLAVGDTVVTHPRRVAPKVEWHVGALSSRVGFIVTKINSGAKRVMRLYNQRATSEQWIK